MSTTTTLPTNHTDRGASALFKMLFLFAFFFFYQGASAQYLTSVHVGSASDSTTYGTSGTITYAVTVTRDENGSGSAGLSVTGLPAGVTANFSPTSVTFKGNTATATSTLTLSITASAIAVSNASFTVTATAANSVAGTGAFTINKKTLIIAAANAVKCFNTNYAVGSTAFSATGLVNGQTVGSVTLTSSGAAATAAVGTYPIVPSAVSGGNFTAANYLITYSNGVLTVNAIPTSAVISGSAAICSGSSTNLQVAITGGLSPYTVVYATGSVNNYTSGSTIPVSPTSATTYRLTSVIDANGCLGTGNIGSAIVTVTTTTTSTDGGLSWNNGIPNSSTAAIFSGSSGEITTNFQSCSLKLTNGATVVVNSGIDVNVVGALTVDAGSTFTLRNNANLLQSGTTNSNSGTIIVQRNSSAVKRLDYTAWSSPVIGQGLYAFSKLTLPNRFYVYDSSTNLYSNSVGFTLNSLQYPSPLVAPIGVNGTDSNSVKFAAGKGYLIRLPWDHPTAPSIWTGTFTGVPNTGNISYTLADGGVGNRFNLVGNPYPSPIDAEAFLLNATNRSSTMGTLYFWRKTNGVGSSYCTLNLGGFTSNGASQVFDPNGVIQTGQGFFVEGNGGGSGKVDFTNAMRITNHSNQFFRSSNSPSTATSIERNRIWLNATSASGLFIQTLVGYMTSATNGVDSAFDGKYINDGALAMASLIDDVPYAIQGRTLPFDRSDVVPIHFKVTTAGDYTISIDHVDGLFTNAAQPIYIKDNLTNITHDLKTGGYTFSSSEGTFNSRFQLVYQGTLAISTPSFTENQVVIYKTPTNEISINAGNVVISSIKIFDIRGRVLFEKNDINASQTLLDAGLSTEIMLVQITSDENKVVTKKVLFPRTVLKLDKNIKIGTQVAEDE